MTPWQDGLRGFDYIHFSKQKTLFFKSNKRILWIIGIFTGWPAKRASRFWAMKRSIEAQLSQPVHNRIEQTLFFLRENLDGEGNGTET